MSSTGIAPIIVGGIGRSHFVEVISVDPYSVPLCATAIVGQSRWQNPDNRFDVLDDGAVTVDDYKALQAFYESYGAGPLPVSRATNEPYVDVDGDGSLSDRDLQQLARYLADKNVRDPVPTACHPVNSFTVQRDLVLPGRVTTVRDAAVIKSLSPARYVPYRRNWAADTLTAVRWSDLVNNKDSLVYIEHSLLTDPSPYAPGCAPEPCILRLLRRRCQYVCGPDEKPHWAPTCGRTEILPGRYVVGSPLPNCEQPPQVIVEPTEHKLARTVIIALFDEADEWYVGWQPRRTGILLPKSPEQRYEDDKSEWQTLVQRFVIDDLHVRLGVLQPYHYCAAKETYWRVLCPTCQFPGDSDRTGIDHQLLSGPPAPSAETRTRNPRVTATEIVDFFDRITSGGLFDPTYLMFVLDNSGSISVSEYRAAVDTAKSQLQTRFPQMEILLDMVTERPERWLHAAAEAVMRALAAFAS